MLEDRGLRSAYTRQGFEGFCRTRIEVFVGDNTFKCLSGTRLEMLVWE